MKKTQQRGFSIAGIITAILIIGLVCIIGFFGWRIINNDSGLDRATINQEKEVSPEQKDRADEIRRNIDQDRLKQNITDAAKQKNE